MLSRLLAVVSMGSLRIYKYYLIAQPVSRKSLLPSGRGKKIEIRMIHQDDIVIRQFPRPAAVIRERFRQGAQCLAAFKDERFVGFLWLLTGSYQEDEVRARYVLHPQYQAAWDFDVYVAPESRLGLTFPRLWDEANRYLTGKGISWSCSRISAFNPGSLGAHARLGTVSMGSAVFFCAGRWQVMLSSVPPYFHLSAEAASFPEFRLDTQNLEKESRT
ncbi:N-acetyltransferase [Nitrosovibrio sp. Nv17]|uniref:N-acetyltransferase n=1 Tax=Nitrosovibrio sp. Nv17 TaxID=1855339 RepID=UPI00116055C6|nr:N-acetyltransferase [Nitrosovibrio sp. Nv17]